MENWKTVLGYEGYYEVSDMGRVRSLDRIVNSRPGVKQKLKGRMKIQKRSLEKYFSVTLSMESKTKHKNVHRLVANAFIPNPHNKPCINHKDGNGFNNKVENLEWCTHHENTVHAYKTNLFPVDQNSGQKNGRSKLTNEEALTIRESYKNFDGTPEHKYKELAKAFGVSRTTIRRIVLKTHWNI